MNDEVRDPGRQKRFILGNWTSDDKKQLIITIAATVAANVITIIIIALAIIVARSFRPHPATSASYAILLSSSTVPISIILMALSVRSDYTRSASIVGKIVKLIMTVIAIATGFLILLGLLGWIGIAVGVK